MSIVPFLETPGAAPSAMSAANYAHAVEAVRLEDAARNALMARDAAAIDRALGGPAETRCIVFADD